MARVTYNALDASGREVTGILDAADQRSALDLLDAQGLIPIDIKVSANNSPWWERDVFGGRARLSDTAIFLDELSHLLLSNIALDDALSIISDDASSLGAGMIASAVLEHVRHGETVSSALEAENIPIGRARLAIVRVGEASGRLASAIDDVAKDIGRERALRQEVLGILFYPIVLLVAALSATIFILTVLLPSLEPVFFDAGAALPPLLAWLLLIGDGFQRYGFQVLILSFVLVAALTQSRRREGTRLWVDRRSIRLPIIGALIKKIETARVNRSLGALISNGVPIPEALAISQQATTNAHVAHAVRSMTEAVRHGENIASCYANMGVFPPLACRLVKIGERTGQLGSMLTRSAEMLDVQNQRDIRRSIAIATPVLTLSIGVLIGGIVLVVMDAILSVNDLAF
ncbi:MAG: type II secretion system F family protein [Pseudomonadota bacterium]